jgi:uncharacterized membrane protein
MNSDSKIWQIFLIVVCLFYIFLRFWHLTDSCLWFDEIFSVHAAEHSWSSINWFIAQDLIHPPLFYYLLKIWILIGGENLFWVRVFPVFFSIISLVPLILLGRELKLNYQIISLAVLFLAVNGALIKYSQEVRMYSVLLCLSLFSIWLFVRFLFLGKNIWILTLINILLIYTHYFGWLIIFTEVMAIIIFQRIKIRQILIMVGILIVGFSLWVFEIWKAANTNADFAQNISWIPKPNFETIFVFIFDLIEPFYFQQSSIEPTSNFLITIPLLLAIFTVFSFYIANWKAKDSDEKQTFLLLLIFVNTPVLLALAASWLLPYSVWGTRHLISVFPFSAILIALILDKIELKFMRNGLIILFVGLFLTSFYQQTKRETPIYIWCAWEILANDLDKNQKTRIYVFEDEIAYNFWFALRNSQENFEIINVNTEKIPEDKAYFLPRGFDGIRTADEKSIEGDRFYVAFRDTELNELHPPLKNLINKGYKIGKLKVFESVGLKGFLIEVYK